MKRNFHYIRKGRIISRISKQMKKNQERHRRSTKTALSAEQLFPSILLYLTPFFNSVCWCCGLLGARKLHLVFRIALFGVRKEENI